MEDADDLYAALVDSIEDDVGRNRETSQAWSKLRSDPAQLRVSQEQFESSLDLGQHPVRGARAVLRDLKADIEEIEFGARSGENPAGQSLRRDGARLRT